MDSEEILGPFQCWELHFCVVSDRHYMDLPLHRCHLWRGSSFFPKCGAFSFEWQTNTCIFSWQARMSSHSKYSPLSAHALCTRFSRTDMSCPKSLTPWIQFHNTLSVACSAWRRDSFRGTNSALQCLGGCWPEVRARLLLKSCQKSERRWPE